MKQFDAECDPTRAPCPTCDGEGGWLREPRTDEERAQGVETVHDECPDCYGHGTLDARALAAMVRELRGALADESRDLADRAAALEHAEGEAWRPGLVRLCHELGVAIHEDASQGIRAEVAFWKREAAEHIAVADQHAAEVAAWQNAAGLIPGDESARDPGDTTPAMLRAWMERHDRDTELTEAIRNAGRALAEIAEADIQACGHRDPGAEICDESCPCCGEAQVALQTWARANWRWHRRESADA